MPATDPTSAERSQRHRLRLAERLDQIEAAVVERATRVERQIAELRVYMSCNDRRSGRGVNEAIAEFNEAIAE
jgi:hypothetical protein